MHPGPCLLTTQTIEALQQRRDALNDFMLHRVRREHERLSALIEREQRRPFPDPWRLAVLKRRKLAVKDRLSGLQARSERQLQPA
jgi:hypothetical protein